MMKPAFFVFCLLALFFAGGAREVNGQSHRADTGEDGAITFFQLNLWHECDKAPDAFNSLVDHIADLKPDIASFCELYRDDDDPMAVLPRLVEELGSRGLHYHAASGNGDGKRGVISRFTLADAGELNGSVFKIRVQAPGRDIIVYSAHLYYCYYSCYLPRGYNDGGEGGWEKLASPVTDTELIIDRCIQSGRPEAIAAVIEDAGAEVRKGRAVILAGDFNEPSHLDWTEATKTLWDHNGCVIPWPVSSLLTANGFTDSFREIYPDPVKNPGFTFPAGHPEVPVEELTWAPDADERERIDFIYYHPASGLHISDIMVVGPESSVMKSVKTADPDRETIIPPLGGRWPSDHKGLFATFRLN